MNIEQNHLPAPSSCESAAVAAIHCELLRLSERHLRREPLRHLWSPECLVNEAYIRLVHRYGKAWFERENAIPLWSHIMRNVLIDTDRSVRTRKRNQGEEEPILETQPDPASSDVELALRVRVAIDRVSAIDPRLSLVLLLRFRDGFTVEELSQRLNKPSRTIRKTLRKARDRFFEAFSARRPVKRIFRRRRSEAILCEFGIHRSHGPSTRLEELIGRTWPVR